MRAKTKWTRIETGGHHQNGGGADPNNNQSQAFFAG
jgi:hypothetical protein